MVLTWTVLIKTSTPVNISSSFSGVSVCQFKVLISTPRSLRIDVSGLEAELGLMDAARFLIQGIRGYEEVQNHKPTHAPTFANAFRMTKPMFPDPPITSTSGFMVVAEGISRGYLMHNRRGRPLFLYHELN